MFACQDEEGRSILSTRLQTSSFLESIEDFDNNVDLRAVRDNKGKLKLITC